MADDNIEDGIKARMKRRSVEIGRMLRNARTSRNVSISECAALIGTGRPRYRDIEIGESYISAVELEVLMEHLDIPQEASHAGSGGERKILRIPVSVTPDDTIYLVVDVAQSSE
jgi:transcriptional regulator with XRE-family HTH domain